jgi:serine/threonine-protein kinase
VRLGSADSLHLVGRTLADTYRLLAPLGEGGFGAVYRAEHLLMGRECAVKVLKDRLAPRRQEQSQTVERFRREVQLCSRLRHAGAVEVYDARVDPETGRLFFAMELLEGVSLAEYWIARGKLPVDEALEYCIRVADCIAVAHDANVIHRDLKPENIFLSKRGEPVRILDFGSAFVNSDVRLTRPGQCLGTTLYMPDEQVVEAPGWLDGRVDVYALGVTLYHLISGWMIYPADQDLVIVSGRIMRQNPVDIQTVAPWVGDRLAAVIRRAMARQANERHTTMRAFADAMRAVLGATGPMIAAPLAITAKFSPPPGLASASVPSARTPTLIATEGELPRHRAKARRRRLGWLAVAPPAALVLTTIWLLARSPSITMATMTTRARLAAPQPTPSRPLENAAPERAAPSSTRPAPERTAAAPDRTAAAPPARAPAQPYAPAPPARAPAQPYAPPAERASSPAATAATAPSAVTPPRQSLDPAIPATPATVDQPQRHHRRKPLAVKPPADDLLLPADLDPAK